MHPRDKIRNLKELGADCQARKLQGERMVLTSGCFDLLHGGHLEYIYDAGRLGFLVVGINSDSFVRKLKGEGRPVRKEEDRAFTMAGFFPVKLVVVFEDDCELIRAVEPEIYVASATSHVRIWDDRERVELLRSFGCRIVELESKKKDSTTAMIRRAASK